jgi:hypothetical protein
MNAAPITNLANEISHEDAMRLFKKRPVLEGATFIERWMAEIFMVCVIWGPLLMWSYKIDPLYIAIFNTALFNYEFAAVVLITLLSPFGIRCLMDILSPRAICLLNMINRMAIFPATICSWVYYISKTPELNDIYLYSIMVYTVIQIFTFAFGLAKTK